MSAEVSDSTINYKPLRANDRDMIARLSKAIERSRKRVALIKHALGEVQKRTREIRDQYVAQIVGWPDVQALTDDEGQVIVTANANHKHIVNLATSGLVAGCVASLSVLTRIIFDTISGAWWARLIYVAVIG